MWCCIFLYAPKRNDAATCLPSFVNLRKQILAVGSHRPHLYFPISYIWETAISAWGCILLQCAERRGNLFAVVRICVSKFCRSSPFYGSRENPKRHANGNGNFRMWLCTSSVRGTTRQLVCRRSSICASKFCRRLPSPALLLSCQLHMGNGNFRMGLYYFVARKKLGNFLFYPKKDFSD